ncbi:MAG: hypothetical protein QOH75_26, partial [Actinomycetota bacterium]|nr:hypothetical protein [Actinomycetota bacterium]
MSFGFGRDSGDDSGEERPGDQPPANPDPFAALFGAGVGGNP